MSSLPGSPSPWALLAESRRTAFAQYRQSVTVALLVAAVCVAALLTAGRAAAMERSVIASIDDVGTRLVVVTDETGSAGIRADSVAQMQSLPGVTWAFGLGPASDARNVSLPRGAGTTVVRAIVGALPPELSHDLGRASAGPGQALVGREAATALAMPSGAGALTDGSTTATVVGRYHATGALAFLDGQALLTPADASAVPVRYLYVVVDDAARAQDTAAAIVAALHADNPDQVDVAVSTGALRLREAIQGTLGAGSRQLMAVLLCSGMLTVTIATIGAGSARRRDVGRDRALGASRSAIVAGVLLHTGIAAGLGAVLGTGVGVLLVAVTGEGDVPAPTFSAGLAVLTVLVALLGAAPPAVAAARRDPVRILRVP